VRRNSLFTISTKPRQARSRSRYNDAVTPRTEQLLREALLLSPEERTDVAAELLASLDEPAAADEAKVQAAWAREIERRARRVIDGSSAGEPWKAVRGRIADSLTKR
jgi:hypothetical protein